MTTFHDDPAFQEWLAGLKPRDELTVRLAMRDRGRDSGVGRDWAVRIEALEAALSVDEYESD